MALASPTRILTVWPYGHLPLSPLYVIARRVLLDALGALADHRSAFILIGAQAVYARTGSADFDLSVAPFTSDADLAIDPRRLAVAPRIEQAMVTAGFRLSAESGIWIATAAVDGVPAEIPVDLLVPEALAGAGRRAARLPDHGRNAARRTPGLEAALVDCTVLELPSLEPKVDERVVAVPVAGVAALLVAKAFKIHERVRDAQQGHPHRLKPKDAGDVIRLMRAAAPRSVGLRLREIGDDAVAGASVRTGVEYLHRLFARRRSPGVELAVVALHGAAPDVYVRELAVSYMAELLDAYRSAEATTTTGPRA